MIKKLQMFLLVFLGSVFLCSCAGGSLSSLFGKSHPTRDAALVTATPAEPHNIALLLPLQGDLAATSQAIKNGFLAAYYNSREQKNSVDVKVIDTSGGDIGMLYNQAIAAGAEIVVGPLTKSDVEVLAASGNLPIPVIALNTLENYQSHVTQNLYQFGLLPQDEAVQVAAKMMGAGLKRVAIIAPRNVWGEKVVNAFKDRYTALGGQVVALTDYGASIDLTSQICQLLALDPSQMCVRRSSKNKHEHNPLEAQRRQDIDSFFIVANPMQARQIVPLLKFYYAGDLPIYSISSVYSGTSQPNLDQDLNGVIFCDMPWVIRKPGELPGQLQTMQNQIATTWPGSFATYAKLYALGVDAYTLATSLHAILVTPQTGVPGATGVLYLDDYNHFYRQLDWAQIISGVVM